MYQPHDSGELSTLRDNSKNQPFQEEIMGSSRFELETSAV